MTASRATTASPAGLHCARCGAQSPPGKRFCGDCGAPLAEADPGRGREERRRLAVLFSDLVGSTEIAASLDPEDWRGVAARYQSAAAGAVARFGGHVAQFLGDGLVAYFGWPSAYEDNGERGVRAGLAIIEAIAGLNASLALEGAVRLSVRVGIDSGPVVVGPGPAGETHVFGDAPNIAGRVQSLAPPDTVLITESVRELVGGRFILTDLGEHALKGLGRPVRLHRVVSSADLSRNGARSAPRRRGRFIGRHDELHRLDEALAHARQGRGRAVVISGEAGIGKSRLMEEFHIRMRGSGAFWLDGRGERHFENTPFHPVTRILEQVLAWDQGPGPDRRLPRLERFVADVGLDAGEIVPIVADLMGLPAGPDHASTAHKGEDRRALLLAGLTAWVRGLARLRPLVIAIEDLHWLDPSSLELATRLVEAAATAPILLICTARPEFRPPWPMRAHCVQLTLSRMSDVETRELIAGLGPRRPIDDDVLDAVVERTDGVPLFAEQLAGLVSDGRGRGLAREIPATVHDLLAARLDRLGPARDVARVAAVLGREFPRSLLEAVAGATPAALAAALEALVAEGLIEAGGAASDPSYGFCHALMHDAAYDGLLRRERRDLHGRAARVLTERFAGLAAAQPQVLARHWSEAGEPDPASRAWHAVARAAHGRSAFREAEEAYGRALAELAALPEGGERDSRELELCSALVQVQQITHGYAAPEAVATGERARALAERVGDLTQRVRQDVRTWRAIIVAGDYTAAAALADRILDLSRVIGGQAVLLAFAHNAQVQTRFYTGDLAGVEAHFARLEPFLAPGGPRQSPGDEVIAVGVASLAAWLLGRGVAAEARLARAHAIAEASGDPYDLAMVLHFEGLLRTLQNDPLATEAAASRLLALAETNGFAYAGVLARGALGIARARLGRPEEGVALLREAAAGLQRARVGLGVTFLFACLAEAHALAGDPVAALEAADEALECNPQEQVFHPLILGLRAELRALLELPDQGDGALARVLADRMSAKLWT